MILIVTILILLLIQVGVFEWQSWKGPGRKSPDSVGHPFATQPVYIYIYIYIERERERAIDVYR